MVILFGLDFVPQWKLQGYWIHIVEKDFYWINYFSKNTFSIRYLLYFYNSTFFLSFEYWLYLSCYPCSCIYPRVATIEDFMVFRVSSKIFVRYVRKFATLLSTFLLREEYNTYLFSCFSLYWCTAAFFIHCTKNEVLHLGFLQ